MGTATGNTPKQSAGYVENLYVKKKPRGTTDISCLQDENLLQDCNICSLLLSCNTELFIYFLLALIFSTADWLWPRCHSVLPRMCSFSHSVYPNSPWDKPITPRFVLITCTPRVRWCLPRHLLCNCVGLHFKKGFLICLKTPQINGYAWKPNYCM